ncbi:MAG: O-antigen ligase family protein, partial [Firmicutes bacterium]|nr:O-antigen ligase family protein [Bacillota bacterium]
MLYIASKPLAVWFPSSGATPESSPMDRVFLIVLILAALYVLFRRKFPWSSAIKGNIWVIFLLGYMLASVLWSHIPGTAIIRWVRELEAVLMAFVVLSELKPRQALEGILRRTTYILIPFSVLLIRYFPKYGVQYGRWSGAQSWIGVTLQKNGLGRLCLIAIFFLFWSLVRRRQGHNPPVWKYQTIMELTILAMALWLLKGPGVGAYSATAVVALFVGLFVYAGLALLRKFDISITAGPLMAIVSIFIIFGILTLFTGASAVGSIAPSIGRDATLTDRTEVWRTLLPIAMKHPILGHGFGSFWTPRTRELFMISEGHN